MGDQSSIEWTDATWNPLAGCAAVSPGCDHCYAARDASARLKRRPQYAGLAVNGAFTGEVRLLGERLDQPLRWRKPRLIFVNSMSDLFHKDVPDHFRLDVWSTMQQARRHTFQVLTKRPQLMARFCRRLAWTEDGHVDALEPYLTPGDPITCPRFRGRLHESGEEALPNVWLGTSIEMDKYAFRADHLRRMPAAVRFLSCEPLLGPLPSLDLTMIDWLIAGGESGPGARPMNPEWVRDLRDRCLEAGVAFHFKQWGEWAPPDAGSEIVASRGLATSPPVRTSQRFDDGTVVTRWGKKAAGRLLDGRTWDEYPPAVAA